MFERPYGFAWLLQLESELRTWPDTQAQRWAANVAPLATWMADSLGGYIKKLVEPVRTGAQTNTAQSMTLALDYADVAGDAQLRRTVVSTARKFYLADTTCATQSERVASGAGGRGGRGGGGRAEPAAAPTADSARVHDAQRSHGGARDAARQRRQPVAAVPEILSPCLSEAALMSRVLDQRAFVAWLDRFLPPLQSGRFAPLTEPIAIPTSAPAATARGGGGADTPDTAAAAAATALATEHARLAGLSFARAQAMERIARALPATDPRVAAWHRLVCDSSGPRIRAVARRLRRHRLAAGAGATLRDDTESHEIDVTITAHRRAHPRRLSRSQTNDRADSAAAPKASVFTDLASFYASLPAVDPHPFDRTTALQLSAMPLSCMDHPQPRPDAVPYLWDATYTPVPDYETTRAFYGCYDWHSAVNSAWTLVRILKTFPDLPTAPAIRQKLNDHFGATNIAGDLEFMRGAGTFELPYGYAWLLRLQYELRSWNDSDAVRWAANMQPMATYMSERMIIVSQRASASRAHRRASQHRHGDGQRARLRARLRSCAGSSDSRSRPSVSSSATFVATRPPSPGRATLRRRA